MKSDVQMEYAALDAAVLIHIFRRLHGHPQYAGNIKEEQTKVEWKSHIVSSKSSQPDSHPSLSWTLLWWFNLHFIFRTFTGVTHGKHESAYKSIKLKGVNEFEMAPSLPLPKFYCRSTSKKMRQNIFSSLTFQGYSITVSFPLFFLIILDVVYPFYSQEVKASPHVDICLHVNRHSTDLINS